MKDKKKNGDSAVNQSRAKKRGRPEQFVRLPATPEEAARTIFSAVKPPDPSKRIQKNDH